MTQITIKTKDKNKPTSKKTLQTVECGVFFEQFVDSLRASDSKPNGLTHEALAIFRSETTDILSHCNPHDAVTNPETTHLVVGYVQSGKTMSFTGLTALAKDNGYRVVVYLAGTKNNLLYQTSKRLKKDLIGLSPKNNNHYKVHSEVTIDDVEDIVGHLESSDHPIILIPILKHYKHISRLTEVVSSAEYKSVMKNETVLIIDDEADQASMNSFGRKNSERKSEEEELSSTYDEILKLRAVLPGNTYIQYTATPQANILISIQDLLSPKSHTLLTPGEGYIGGKLFFGKGVNHDLFKGGLIIQIPEEEVFHKKRNILKKMPSSLKRALIFHTLAVAIVVKWQAPDDITYLSMMVHPDNEKKWNRTFKNWIENEFKNWRKILKMPDGCDDKVYLIEEFKKIFPEAVEFYSPEERPTFEQIEPFISDVIHDKKVYLVNTDKDAQTEIEWDNYKMHILVGAEMLNRGFTVEKLATTYMPRYATGPTNADTIQQRCRFFGYKKSYIRSCRVFLPQVTIANYHAYVDHEEELRNFLKTSDTLVDVERSILLSPSLRPTRRNILPKWVVCTQLKGMCAMQAFASRYTIEHNDKLVEEFLKRHSNDFSIRPDSTLDRTHRWMKLDIDEAIEFLSNFNFKNWPDAQRKANTIRYLRYLSSEDNERPLKYVYFYQMSYKAGPRHRNFDKEKCRLATNTELFAGPSSAKDSTNYPGDRKIYGSEETITIQLHHIEFDGAALDFPRTAYTLAIYYPKTLATSYIQNLGDDIDDFE